MHPMFRLTPKEKWKAQHRSERMRRQGKTEDEIRGFTSYVGTWEGVRIIETTERS